MTNRNPYTDNTTPSQTVVNQPSQSNPREYENGYVDRRLREEAETNAISTGLLWALVIFLLSGAGFLSYFFFFNQNRQTPTEQTSPAAPAVIPQPQQTTIVQPTKETQIIERTVEKNQPASPTVDAPPQINIQVPPAPMSPTNSLEQTPEPLSSSSPSASPETPSSDSSSAESP
jgi:outer membrane biosynthesis protein TonB